MPLRPDEIENREFASSLRGFDKHEVRAFLRRVASDVDELEARLTEDVTRGEVDQSTESETASAIQLDEDRFAALGDRIANLLRQAHEAASETRQQSEERAFELRSSAEDELEAARVQAGRFREEAEASATAIRSQAEEEAGRLRSEAEHLKVEADRLHGEAVSVREQADEHANHVRGEADEHANRVRGEADEHATRLRAEADGLWAEAERVRGEAQRLHDEAQAARQEADEYAGHLRGEAESDAVAIRDRAELEGAARLDDRRTEIEQAEERIEAERQAALLEVADARGQVATLLEEARAQSEFIKREAEEIIRGKVRNNIDQAQRRIDLLRNTETSSRNRILTAQRELEAALSRLDAETASELGSQTEEEVLIEAEQRAIDSDYPPFRSDRAADDPRSGDEGDDENAEGTVIEGHLVEVPETSYRPSAEGHGEASHGEEGDLEPAESDTAEEQAPENEDALARLVREAMQRAVEGARNENR